MNRFRNLGFGILILTLFLGGCSQLSTVGGASSGSSGSSSSKSSASSSANSTVGGTATTAELLGVATSISGQFGVAVGTGGAILQSTSTGSSSSVNFPTWYAATSPTSNNLRGVSFDINAGSSSPANVVAVGDGGAILENTSSGQNSPQPWLLGSATSGFTLSDSACAATGPTNFSPTLYGVSLFTANQNVVAVGGPFTDTCGHTKGVIAVSTASAGVLPYSGWKLVDTYGSGAGTALPAVAFRGVSFAERASSSAFAVVVGDSGKIFIGTAATGLQLGTSWAINTTSDSGTAQLNAVAVAQDNANAVIAGNGVIYVNSNIGSTTTWTKLTLPTGVSAANYTGVHFTTGSALTAIVVGQSPTEILLVSNCCNSSSTITNVTPTVSGLGNLDAVWGGLGPAAGLGLASGAGGYILENDNGGATATDWTRVH